MKKTGKRKKSQHRGPRPVRLSQCMIVKNEEKNIERALTWAKKHAFEQIVVDTGSTDRTVEIAERMGAKVYHFEWINDFSAAKNYAIGQATGNWIAFLDADEYFPEEDADKLMLLLGQLQADPVYNDTDHVVCRLVNVNDEGKPFNVMEHVRVFRNRPYARYHNAIHESLDGNAMGRAARMRELTIIHTGYAQSEYREKQKATRNLEMLERELAQNPDDLHLKQYTAESLLINPTEENRRRALTLLREVADSDQPMNSYLKTGSFFYLIRNLTILGEPIEEVERYCRKAIEQFPENPDFHFCYGSALQEKKDYRAAFEAFQRCEELLKGDEVGGSHFVMGNAKDLFYALLMTAVELNEVHDIIRYATHMLKEDRYEKGVLGPYIRGLKRHGGEEADREIFELLSKLYDYNNLRDKLTILQCAKDSGMPGLGQMIYDRITPEEWAWLKEGRAEAAPDQA